MCTGGVFQQLSVNRRAQSTLIKLALKKQEQRKKHTDEHTLASDFIGSKKELNCTTTSQKTLHGAHNKHAKYSGNIAEEMLLLFSCL